MWQRIQTVFLGGLVLCLVVSLVQPIWHFTNADMSAVLTPFYLLKTNQYQYVPYVLTAILSIAVITLAITSIRKYANRITQLKIGALNSLLLVGVIGASAYFGSQMIKEFQGGEYGLGLYLPAAGVVFNLLANFFCLSSHERTIQKEKLLLGNGRD